jgi:hypothetical protein
MPKREVDQRKTRKALRKLRQAAERAEGEGGPGLTTWEKDFVEGVTTRLETYGSAFRDPGKGRLEEALSARQHEVTRVITAKSRKAAKEAKDPAVATSKAAKPDKPEKPDRQPGSTFKRKSTFRSKAKPGWKPRVRDINDDPEATPDSPPPAPKLRIIKGGQS